jgi:hypothetical protein
VQDFLKMRTSSKTLSVKVAERESGQTQFFNPLPFHGFHTHSYGNGLDFPHLILATQNSGNVRFRRRHQPQGFCLNPANGIVSLTQKRLSIFRRNIANLG